MKPHWARALALACQLGVAPASFWRLSVREWTALSASAGVSGLGRADFAALMARYPDTAETPTQEGDDGT